MTNTAGPTTVCSILRGMLREVHRPGRRGAAGNLSCDSIRFGGGKRGSGSRDPRSGLFRPGADAEHPCGYPINFIDNAEISGKGGIPKVVIFLTADSFGVLPPISRLSKNAAMYQFVTGFTAKVAGTERGIKEPQPTFSTLFGEPFMPLRAECYAEMLGERLEKYGTKSIFGEYRLDRWCVRYRFQNEVEVHPGNDSCGSGRKAGRCGVRSRRPL